MKTEKWFEPNRNEMLLLLSFESDTPPAHVSFLSLNNKEFIQLLIQGHSPSHEGGHSRKSWSFHNHSSKKRTNPNVHIQLTLSTLTLLRTWPRQGHHSPSGWVFPHQSRQSSSNTPEKSRDVRLQTVKTNHHTLLNAHIDSRSLKDWKVEEMLMTGESRRNEVTGDVSAKGIVGHQSRLCPLLVSCEEGNRLTQPCTRR